MRSVVFDIAIIGGGINGCGIARDAAGRGLSVYLCEKSDLAGATSSASTKLIHGGLRYLEYYEFRLVREALMEREVLLRAGPHIISPLRFVLPHHKGLRPAWLIRLALFLYDHLGGRKLLPPTRPVDLTKDEAGLPLKPDYRRGFEYSDCWVDDARLVVLNAIDAAERGAVIETRTEMTKAERTAGGMARCRCDSRDADRRRHRGRAERAISSAKVLAQRSAGPPSGSAHEEEIDYLCRAASEYFRQPIAPASVVWTYSGVRPLHDDGASAAQAATRDYVLKLDGGGADAPPVLNIYGGKITTYRRLAEAALQKLQPFFAGMGRPWTAEAPLPGGDFPVGGVAALAAEIMSLAPSCPQERAERLAHAYGTRARAILEAARVEADWGASFGSGLTEREVRYLMEHEWARTAEDVLWRRSKLGLRVSAAEAQKLDQWMRAAAAVVPSEAAR